MPVNTKMAKSGLKKVQKQNRKQTNAPLNRAARSLGRADAAKLTSGVVTDDFKPANRAAAAKQRVILDNRRRRH
jgi:hypothetical protein